MPFKEDKVIFITAGPSTASNLPTNYFIEQPPRPNKAARRLNREKCRREAFLGYILRESVKFFEQKQSTKEKQALVDFPNLIYELRGYGIKGLSTPAFTRDLDFEDSEYLPSDTPRSETSLREAASDFCPFICSGTDLFGLRARTPPQPKRRKQKHKRRHDDRVSKVQLPAGQGPHVEGHR